MKESGAIIITTPAGETQRSTLQCCHCGNHFISVRGSGIQRGFCIPCGKVTCGAKRCMAHLPFEKRLDLIEAGKLPLIEL
jgi:hypothetical protein